MLVAGLTALPADGRPRALISQSATGYYGPRGDVALDEQASPGDDFLAELTVAWEREATSGPGLDARRLHPHRGRALTRRRGAGQDAAVLQAGDRRPGGGRSPVRPVDPSRRRRRGVPALPRSRWGRGRGQPHRSQSRHQRRALPGARPRPRPPGRAARPRRSRSSCSTARWPRWSPPASARSRPSCGELGYAFRHPEIEAALKDVLSDR